MTPLIFSSNVKEGNCRLIRNPEAGGEAESTDNSALERLNGRLMNGFRDAQTHGAHVLGGSRLLGGMDRSSISSVRARGTAARCCMRQRTEANQESRETSAVDKRYEPTAAPCPTSRRTVSSLGLCFLDCRFPRHNSPRAGMGRPLAGMARPMAGNCSMACARGRPLPRFSFQCACPYIFTWKSDKTTHARTHWFLLHLLFYHCHCLYLHNLDWLNIC